MVGTSLKLRSLKKVDQELRNFLSTHVFPVHFSLVGEWSFSFLAPLTCHDYSPSSGRSFWSIHFFWGKGFFSLFVPDSVFFSCVEDWLADTSIQIPKLEPPLLLAVVDATVDQILQNMSQLGFVPVRLHAVNPVDKNNVPDVSTGHWVASEVCCLSKKEKYPIWFHTDKEGCSFLSYILGLLPPVQHSLFEEFVPVVLRLCVGRTKLTFRQLKSVRKSDVILFDESYIQDGVLFVYVSGTIGFRALWKNNQLIVQTELETVMGEKSDENLDTFWDDEDTELIDTDSVLFDDEEDDEDDEDTVLVDQDREEVKSEAVSSAQKVSLPDVQNIPVHLTFDLGEKSLSFKELSVIQPGYVFDLGRPLNHSVSIRANQKVIGMGELVEIEGHLGVSVSELKKK